MSLPRLLLISALAGLAACTGREDSSSVAGPRPSAGISASSATTSDADAGDEGSSSACIAYTARRDAAAKLLSASPDDLRLQDRVESLQEIVDDVCN
jgi:hypothetical protein